VVGRAVEVFDAGSNRWSGGRVIFQDPDSTTQYLVEFDGGLTEMLTLIDTPHRFV